MGEDDAIFTTGLVLPDITPIAQLDDTNSTQNTINEKSMTDGDDKHQVKLVFRSYKPYSSNLEKYIVDTATIVDDYEWATKEADDMLKQEDEIIKFLDNDIEKKPTWDLKRDLKPKLELLDEKTNQAIAILVKHKMFDDSSKS